MTKRLLFIYKTRPFDNQVLEINEKYLRKFAKKINAEVLISDFDPQKAKEKLLQNYEILFVNSNVLIRQECPDPFNLFEKENSFASTKLSTLFQTETSLFDFSFFLARRPFYKILSEAPPTFTDNSYFLALNKIIAKSKIPTQDLGHKFSHTELVDKATGYSRFSSYVINYSTAPPVPEYLKTLKDDLEIITSNPIQDFDYKNILVRVKGGLGDQVAAEPTTRYIIEKISLSKKDKIVIATDFPRIYAHYSQKYENVTLVESDILKKGWNQLFPHGTPWIFETYTDDNKIQAEEDYFNHIDFQLTDYTSIYAFRRQLRLSEKRIELALDLDDLSKLMDMGVDPATLSNSILIHAGTGWPSKTYPTEWWQYIVDELSKAGHHITLIGKRVNEKQNYADVIAPEANCFDLRDLTDLGGLFLAISYGKLLVTNDSAPVHIAGAFDNWIYLLSSCRYPDHILPYRHESQNYKSGFYELNHYVVDELYKLGSMKTVDQLPDGQTIENFLPEKEKVIKEINEILEKIEKEKNEK